MTTSDTPPPPRPCSRIVGFRPDEAGEWIARLDCGHERHVRHDPPWRLHPWVTSAAGRRGALGRELRCGHCEGARHLVI